jgi:hypothetical protein
MDKTLFYVVITLALYELLKYGFRALVKKEKINILDSVVMIICMVIAAFASYFIVGHLL